MKNSLLFDFTIDKASNTVFVNREFRAAPALVWDAFTKAEILDQWWAPKPWQSKTKSMEFAVGGRRLYAMVGPGGEEHWSVQDFTAITPGTSFRFLDAFADSNGTMNDALPGSEWNLDFSESGAITTVRITIRHKTPEDLEKILEMGFREGFTMTLNELENLLAAKA